MPHFLPIRNTISLQHQLPTLFYWFPLCGDQAVHIAPTGMRMEWGRSAESGGAGRRPNTVKTWIKVALTALHHALRPAPSDAWHNAASGHFTVNGYSCVVCVFVCYCFPAEGGRKKKPPQELGLGLKQTICIQADDQGCPPNWIVVSRSTDRTTYGEKRVSAARTES